MAKEEALDPRIICAACKKDDIVLCGARHFDLIMHSQIAAMNKEMGFFAGAKQGFIDQYGKFYNREDAMVLAKKNNQLLRNLDAAEMLFSEDLY